MIMIDVRLLEAMEEEKRSEAFEERNINGIGALIITDLGIMRMKNQRKTERAFS